jgi:hypothetical protein
MPSIDSAYASWDSMSGMFSSLCLSAAAEVLLLLLLLLLLLSLLAVTAT